MKKICKSCGAEAHPRANFCRYCGSSLLVPYEPPRSKGRAIGSFFIYFGIWLAAQVVTSVVFLVPITLSLFSNPNLIRMDYDKIYDLLMNKDGTPTARAQKILAHTPMNRFGVPADLTGTLLWLADKNASGFVNGVVVPVIS